MADNSVPLVAPFAGERYAAQDRLSDLIAPPYDVIPPADREVLAARDRCNIVHLILPPQGKDGYAAAARALGKWRAEGVLKRDPQPSVYVVQQEFVTPDGRPHIRTGVIAGVHIEPYARGRIRPHERTHPGPKEDRLALARATGALLETIFVLARDERGHLKRRLDGVTRHQATAMADHDGVGIGLWRVGGVQAREIAHVAGESALYIADGHHRFETANAYRQENSQADRIPALIVPVADPGLVVLPTHRLITGGPIDAGPLLKRWDGAFTVEQREPEVGPQGVLEGLTGSNPAAAVVLPDGRLFVLRARDPGEGELEIAVIEREVVQPLRAAAGGSGAVDYTANPADVFDAMGRSAASAAVLVRPTPVDRVLQTADAGGILPPKSTYFIPKVPSGLVILSAEQNDA
jgi:uncharacterized protein (DUF1015 family)